MVPEKNLKKEIVKTTDERRGKMGCYFSCWSNCHFDQPWAIL
jgi:hypothetical protein